MLGNMLIATALMALTGFLYFVTLGFPPPMAGQENIPGPGLFPKAIIIALWIFCLSLIYRTFRGKEIVQVKLSNFREVCISAVAMVIAYMLIEPVGFFIVLPCYLVFQTRLLFFKQWKTIFMVNVVAIAFIYIVFYRILRIPFPMGIIELLT